MKRQFLRVCLVWSSGPAYAEWVVLPGGGDDAGLAVYVDPDTIRNNGDRVKMWSLYNYTTIQSTASAPYSSYKVQNEYDCAEERYRFLSRAWFSGYMGTGNVVFENTNESKWEPVAPESVGKTLWKFACGKQ